MPIAQITGFPQETLLNRILSKMALPLDSFAPKVKKVYKTMMVSSQEDIDLHNKAVKTRQVQRSNKRLNDKLLRT